MKKFICIILSMLILVCTSSALIACNNPTDSSPSSIMLNTNNIELNVGETYQLYAIVSPSTAKQTVTFVSFNTSIATINAQGVITAKGKGNATIQAKTSNGLVALCNVQVTVAVGSIEGSVTYSPLSSLSTDYADIDAVIQLIPTNIQSFPTTYKYLSGYENYEAYGIYTAKTNSSGNYSIDNIPVGTYLVVARSGNANVPAQTSIDRENDTTSFINGLFGYRIGAFVNASIDTSGIEFLYINRDVTKSEVTITANRTQSANFSFIDFY